MGIRSTLGQILSAPTHALVESALRDLVDEVIASHDFVRRDEVVTFQSRLDGLRRELTERRSELDALRQSVEAFSLDLDDDLGDEFGLPDPEQTLSRLEAGRAEMRKQLERALGALEATQSQLGGLSEQIDGLRARADQAHQVATTARATAETAADGVSALEDRLA